MNKSIVLISVSIEMGNYLKETNIKKTLFNSEIYKKEKVKTFLIKIKNKTKIFYLDENNNLKTVEYYLKGQDKTHTMESVVLDVVSNEEINQLIITEEFSDESILDIRNRIFYPIIQKWFNITNPSFFNNKIIWKKDV